MNPPDRTSPPQRGTGPDRAAARQDEQDARLTGNLRRRLEAPPEGEEARPRARRRNAMLPHHGGAGNAFAAAAAMQHPGPVSAAARAVVRPRMETVMVSVSDNMIGSIYFTNGRVRTTHASGPERIREDPNRIHRFNINMSLANAAFMAAQPEAIAQVADTLDWSLPTNMLRQLMYDGVYDRRDAWFAEVLQHNDQLPAWAEQISGPEGLPDIDAPRPNRGTQLIEVLDGAPGTPPHVHTSRGEMVQMTLPRQSLEMIVVAFHAIEHVQDPQRRNEIFFSVLAKYAPDLANRIRRP
jgi:hypothetical protein